MNEQHDKYIQRAITNYGIQIDKDVRWFIDENKIYLGNTTQTGEIVVVGYLSGFIFRSVFIIDYITANEILDIKEWKNFISTHLEMESIDAR